MAKNAEMTLKNPGKPATMRQKANAFVNGAKAGAKAGALAGAAAQKKADNTKRVTNGGAKMLNQLKSANGKLQNKG